MAFIPQPTESQLRERIRRDFPPAEHEEVFALLTSRQLPLPPSESPYFVPMLVLRMANGRKNKIAEFLSWDPRDLMMWIWSRYGGDWYNEFVPSPIQPL
jgi:hypothetical protein